jgi:hypothetical protein
MRRAALVWVATIIVVEASSSPGSDFWMIKPYREWKAAEVQKMLSDSPWAKEATAMLAVPAAENPSGRGAGRGGRSGGMAGGGGMGGGAIQGADGGPMGGAPTRTMSLLVRWTSALPMKQAMVRLRFHEKPVGDDVDAMLEREEDGYVVTLHKLPAALGRIQPQRLREMMMKLATLNRRGKETIRPQEVEVLPSETEGIIVALIFPKNDPITLEDKNVEFVLNLGQMELKRKFELKDMVVAGKLQL